MKVFLGGTCNESTWREQLISLLKCDYFNPVVEDWTPECVENEYREKSIADYQLFVITPEATGCFSIAELIDASNKVPEKTLCALLGSWNSNNSVENEKLVGRFMSFNNCLNIAESNGAKRFYTLKNIAEFLNEMAD
ncbi:MAG: nucleoside 2-deoxyribosyltransferase domain-containing protein [Dehalococcoidales bacterium]|jgi:hypothetical protein